MSERIDNPIDDILTGLQNQVANVAGVQWADIYDGEDWNDSKYIQMLRRVGTKGAGVYIRLMRTQLDEGEPHFVDCQRVWFHLIAGAGAIANQATSAAAATQLLWDIYTTIRRTETAAAASLLEAWRLAGIVPEHQSSAATIMSLMITSVVDMALED